jgi:hypothetical protein
MNMELISLIGGSISGFVFKLVGVMVQSQIDLAKSKIETQQAADDSADRAAQRVAGQWVRRGIVATVLFAIVVAPFIVAFTDIGVTIPVEKGWWIFTTMVYETQEGLLIHDSVIQSLYAIIGFYFGSSTLNK